VGEVLQRVAVSERFLLERASHPEAADAVLVETVGGRPKDLGDAGKPHQPRPPVGVAVVRDGDHLGEPPGELVPPLDVAAVHLLDRGQEDPDLRQAGGVHHLVVVDARIRPLAAAGDSTDPSDGIAPAKG
jgi:hypothetical protein